MNIRIVVTGFVILVLGLGSCKQEEGKKVPLKNGIDSLSYAHGVTIGNYYKYEVEESFNPEAFSRAIKEVFNDENTVLTPEEANIFINSYLRKLRQIALERNMKEGREFLAKNREKPGIVELASGVQYEVLKEGDGHKPGPNDRVKIYLKGSLIDGTIFDETSDGNPRSIQVNKSIKGQAQVLQLMKEGAKWRVYIPTELAYGVRTMPGSKLKPNTPVILDIELVEIEKKDTPEDLLRYKEEGEKFLEENKKKEGIKVHPSGVQYEIIKQGNGSKPKATDKVLVHYRGTLIDGTEFDSSMDGDPVSFPANQVIRGWTEILQIMPVGSKYKVYIPSDLAYGERGAPGSPIKPNMALIFEIELLDIVNN